VDTHFISEYTTGRTHASNTAKIIYDIVSRISYSSDNQLPALVDAKRYATRPTAFVESKMASNRRKSDSLHSLQISSTKKPVRSEANCHAVNAVVASPKPDTLVDFDDLGLPPLLPMAPLGSAVVGEAMALVRASLHPHWLRRHSNLRMTLAGIPALRVTDSVPSDDVQPK